jgi:phosphoglycerol transferase MdoB-like AlkP superfamily enzyme
MIQMIYPILMTLIGALFLYRNIALYRDQQKLTAFLNSSLKAKFWVNKLGIEKTTKLAKNVFLPIGTLLSIAIIVTGVWTLTILTSIYY